MFAKKAQKITGKISAVAQQRKTAQVSCALSSDALKNPGETGTKGRSQPPVQSDTKLTPAL